MRTIRGLLMAYVARMLKTTMLRVEIPPMYGNNATAYTHPAFVFKKKSELRVNS